MDGTLTCNIWVVFYSQLWVQDCNWLGFRSLVRNHQAQLRDGDEVGNASHGRKGMDRGIISGC